MPIPKRLAIAEIVKANNYYSLGNHFLGTTVTPDNIKGD